MKIAVIPARGGSKRIPRKNMRLFSGRPMISYAIEAARQSSLFDEIIVSTDDRDIAAVACDFGASTPFARPAALSDDHTGTTAVVAHAARWALDQGWPVETICCLYATAPFVLATDLGAGLERLVRDDLDYVFAAGRFSSPVERGFRLTESGVIEPLFPEHRQTRSQDLAPTFHDAGQFYWAQTKTWIEQRPVFGPHSSFIELPPWRLQDIDTEHDWLMAEYLFQVLGMNK